MITPQLSSSILPGITRDSVIQICRELGIQIVESNIQRAALYIADELFFSGTAAEVTPIRSVDKITVGTGRRGEITRRIQEVFFEITSGEREAPGQWLTYANERKSAQPVSNNGHNATQVKASGASSSLSESVIDYQPAMTE